jgi:superfamily II DNA or RNA helicase
MLVTTQQPLFTGAMACYTHNELLHNLFKFISKYGDAVDMAYREGNLLYVPRECVPVGIEDHRVRYEPCAIDCNFEPRNQEQATLPYESLEALRQGRNHVFEAPTGWGKSIAGALIACLLGQPTMIVVNKQDLMDGWYDAIVNVLKVPLELVGRVQQNECDYKGKRIVIGMAQSLCIPDRYEPELFKYFGFLIVDEAHQMPTEMFSRVFQLFPAYYRLGFSATPDRSDGKWKVIRCHVGPTLIKGTMLPMVPKILVKKTGWKIPTCKVRQADGTYSVEKIPHAPGRMMLVNKAMAASQSRNVEIIDFTISSYKKGGRTLVLSETREHLDRLFQMLTSAGVPGNHIGYYVGGMKKWERESVKANALIILGTFKMCSTGTDCPVWDRLVLANPRSDVRQPIGRILRFMDGKRTPVALDLVDHDPILNAFFINRLKYYYALKSEIVRMD